MRLFDAWMGHSLAGNRGWVERKWFTFSVLRDTFVGHDRFSLVRGIMNSSPPVFLSHSTQDRDITDVIRQSLERSEIGCWIAPDCITKGHSWAQAIDAALDGCSVVLCILSSSANASDPVAKELNMAYDKKKTIIPLRIEDVKPSSKLRFFLDGQWIDAYTSPIDRHLGAIIDHVNSLLEVQRQVQPPSTTAAGSPDVAPPAAAKAEASSTELKVRRAARPQTVALLYKRSAQPDDQVLALLETGLRDAGHNVFVDRHMSIGVEWVAEIERQVREADAVIPLLSPVSVQSEMLVWEVNTALSAADQQFGKPRILPVRVGSEDALPEPFQGIIGRYQYALWRGPEDNQALLSNLLDGLDAKDAPKASTKKGETPGGAVPLDSRYYIVQPTDIEFYEGLERQDGLLLVKGARQMGKTSLLARGLQQARDAGKTVVSLDLEKLNQDDLKDISSLYKAIGSMIADRLKLDVYPNEVWRAGRGPNANFEHYIVEEVMGKKDGHVVIAMDEVDRLFFFDYASDVFGMFRSWFNARTTDPTMPWGRLTQVFVYATEPHLFITNQFQSPFNVGTKIEMNDFSPTQVKELNGLYDEPLKTDNDLGRFYNLFHGQPYLSRRGFYELAGHHLSLDDLAAQADMDEGPFGDHLRRILIMVARDKKTLEVVTDLVHGKAVPDQMMFYNLRSGGLIAGDSPEQSHFRCGIYETYLKRHLGT